MVVGRELEEQCSYFLRLWVHLNSLGERRPIKEKVLICFTEPARHWCSSTLAEPRVESGLTGR